MPVNELRSRVFGDSVSSPYCFRFLCFMSHLYVQWVPLKAHCSIVLAAVVCRSCGCCLLCLPPVGVLACGWCGD